MTGKGLEASLFSLRAWIYHLIFDVYISCFWGLLGVHRFPVQYYFGL